MSFAGFYRIAPQQSTTILPDNGHAECVKMLIPVVTENNISLEEQKLPVRVEFQNVSNLLAQRIKERNQNSPVPVENATRHRPGM